MSIDPKISKFLHGVDDRTFIRQRLIPLIKEVIKDSVEDKLLSRKMPETKADMMDLVKGINLEKYVTQEQLAKVMSGIGEIHGDRVTQLTKNWESQFVKEADLEKILIESFSKLKKEVLARFDELAQVTDTAFQDIGRAQAELTKRTQKLETEIATLLKPVAALEGAGIKPEIQKQIDDMKAANMQQSQHILEQFKGISNEVNEMRNRVNKNIVDPLKKLITWKEEIDEKIIRIKELQVMFDDGIKHAEEEVTKLKEVITPPPEVASASFHVTVDSPSSPGEWINVEIPVEEKTEADKEFTAELKEELIDKPIKEAIDEVKEDLHVHDMPEVLKEAKKIEETPEGEEEKSADS